MEFPQVTRSTQLILDLAGVEASLLRQHEVGCIHIFLALILKPFDNAASMMLRPIGVRLDHARDIARSHVVLPRTDKLDVYPFTDSALRAVERARLVAERKGEGRLTRPEHLLFALIEQYDEVIDEVLEEYDVSSSGLLAEVAEFLRKEGN